MTALKIGILGMQGDIEEHEKAVVKACGKIGVECVVMSVKNAESLRNIDCIIIPGGESTVIGGLLYRSEMLHELRRRISNGLPVLGTCAGLVMLAKRVRIEF